LGKRVLTILENAVVSTLEISVRRSALAVMVLALVLLLNHSSLAQGSVEERRIGDIVVTFDPPDKEPTSTEQFRSIISDAVGTSYSAVRVRDSIDALHKTGRVVSVVVRAEEVGSDSVNLNYVIKRQTEAQRVTVEIGNVVGEEVTEQEILFRLNLIDPGTVINEQTLRDNADLILEYLRDPDSIKPKLHTHKRPLQTRPAWALPFVSFPVRRPKSKNLLLQSRVLIHPA